MGHVAYYMYVFSKSEKRPKENEDETVQDATKEKPKV